MPTALDAALDARVLDLYSTIEGADRRRILGSALVEESGAEEGGGTPPLQQPARKT